MDVKVKAPSAQLDYTVNWNGWLPPGVAIAQSEWDVQLIDGDEYGPADLEVLAESVNATKAQVIVRGGQNGHRYKLTNTITTDVAPIPHIKPHSFELQIEDQT